ncbi:MAG: HPr family phosphocarrier protein [Clostridia bacterium]|nr:HPr family phosphocarrier protein [Clostridia bacterium]MBQ8511727.1 HPr family phosphocarrier protein [Clostridia bacterium]
MREFRYTINDKNGIHARPAGLIVQCAKGYESALTLRLGDKSADCRKLFSLMQLGVKCGDEVILTAQGADEDSAAAELEETMRRAGL